MLVNLFSLNYCSIRGTIPVNHCISYLNPFVTFLSNRTEGSYIFQQNLYKHLNEQVETNSFNIWRSFTKRESLVKLDPTKYQGIDLNPRMFVVIPIDGFDVIFTEIRTKGNWSFHYFSMGLNSFDGLYLATTVYYDLFKINKVSLSEYALSKRNIRAFFMNAFKQVSIGFRFKICHLIQYGLSIFSDEPQYKLNRFPNYHKHLYNLDFKYWNDIKNLRQVYPEYHPIIKEQLDLKLQLEIIDRDIPLDKKKVVNYLNSQLYLNKSKKDIHPKTKVEAEKQINEYVDKYFDKTDKNFYEDINNRDRKSVV